MPTFSATPAPPGSASRRPRPEPGPFLEASHARTDPSTQPQRPAFDPAGEIRRTGQTRGLDPDRSGSRDPSARPERPDPGRAGKSKPAPPRSAAPHPAGGQPEG